jgi:hypothetical protein
VTQGAFTGSRSRDGVALGGRQPFGFPSFRPGGGLPWTLPGRLIELEGSVPAMAGRVGPLVAFALALALGTPAARAATGSQAAAAGPGIEVTCRGSHLKATFQPPITFAEATHRVSAFGDLGVCQAPSDPRLSGTGDGHRRRVQGATAAA